jgi:hypothetical protein
MPSTPNNLMLRLSQAAAVTGLAGAGLAAVLVGRAQPPVPPEVVELPAFTPLDDGQQGQQQERTTPGTASRLGFIANKPKPPTAQPVAVVPQPVAPPPPPPPSVTYHGMVSAGSAPLALLRDGGRQVFVRVGDIVQGKKVGAIEAGLVRLVATVDGGEAQDIPLAERTGASVTLATAPMPAQAMQPAGGTDDVRERMAQLPGKHDFRRLLDPNAPMILAPEFVPPEDVPLYLFVWERFARKPQGEMSPGELEKQVYEQVQGNRDEFEGLARKQLGDRYDELVKTVSVRQSEMRQEFDNDGLSTAGPQGLEKFNKERLRKGQP